MEYRQLGRTDLKLSVVGLGAWAMGGAGWPGSWGPQDDADSIAAIHRALDLGLNWIDTAAVYGLGHSEEVVGRAIRGRRDAVLVATKGGRVIKDGRFVSAGSPAHLRQDVEDSLRRLGIETIDLYQLHWPDPQVPVEDSWGAMVDLLQAGKVRAIGVSNFDVAQLQACQAIHPVASLQPPYSMLRRDIEADILPFCRANAIGVIPYSPLQSGLLTDGFDPARLAADDWRRSLDADRLAKARDLVARLAPLAADRGYTMAQLAVAWVNAQPGVTAAIVGARRPEQVAQNVQAGAWSLSADELAQVAAVLADLG